MKSAVTSPLTNIHHCYLIGIKGVGMTALAQCLIDKGIQVAGCDVSDQFVTEKILSSLPIQIDDLQTQVLPEKTDCVIYGSAHQGTQHHLAQLAMKQSIPLYSHAQILGMLSLEKETVAVCGVGGKSTTSALLAWALEKLTAHPSYQVGVGEIIELPKTGRWDPLGTIFITEADEYAENPQAVARGEKIIPRFHYLKPKVVICTNLLFDHPDVYHSLEQTLATYYDFFTQIQTNGTLIWNATDFNLRDLVQNLKNARPDITTLSFGDVPNADLEIVNLGYQDKHQQARFVSHLTSPQLKDSPIINFSLPGSHNLNNAAATWICLSLLNYDSDQLVSAVSSFKSTSRRFQLINHVGETYYYDDYAHHPTEISATLTACKDLFPHHQLVVIFQPHTFSRTQALLPDFAIAFDQADKLFLLPIFGSAREKIGSITPRDIAAEIRRLGRKGMEVNLASSLQNAVTQLEQLNLTRSVVITLGAGDIYTLHHLLNQAKNQ